MESTIIVYAPGDPSVGISPRTVEVTVEETVEDLTGVLVNITEMREYLTERLTETFSTVYDDGGVEVYFPDDDGSQYV